MPFSRLTAVYPSSKLLLKQYPLSAEESEPDFSNKASWKDRVWCNMAGDTETPNPLVSHRSSDSNLTVALHPLVLLTISDHITRHQMRQCSGNIVGALLGQQKGREISLEHAFECNVQLDDEGQAVLQAPWFEERLQQYKEVHKAPLLDLVGWFTVCPETGPSLAFLPIHRQFLAQNETSLLLAFHLSDISASSDPNSKLPLTIYETVYEHDAPQRPDAMHLDPQDPSGLKFRSIPYTIETDETEMIAVNYVAKGAGNAGALEGTSSDKTASESKGKKRASAVDTAHPSDPSSPATTSEPVAAPLSAEEEDRIAALTTRLNSVRMLQSRLSTLSTYLASLPTDLASRPSDATAAHLPHLRNIRALITRLALLTPHPPSTSPGSSVQLATEAPLSQAQQRQTNDVQLGGLLASLGQDVQALSEFGRRYSLVEKQGKGVGGGGGGGGGGGFGVGGGPGYLGLGMGGVESDLLT